MKEILKIIIIHALTGKWTFADTAVLGVIVSLLFMPVFLIIAR